MADARIIEYKISAVDNASSVVSKYAENLKRLSATTATYDLSPVFGRTNKQLGRDTAEQDARNVIAARTKEMREATRRATAEAVANERMFGTRVAQEVRNSNQQIAKQAGAIDQLKDVFGKRSQFGQIAQLFVGGGAIAAIGFATKHLAHMAEAARDVVDKFRDGEITANKMRVELALTIPIIGSIAKAMVAVNEMFTGEAANIRHMKEEQDLLNASMETRIAIEERAKKAHEDSLKTLRELNDEAKLRFMPEPLRGLEASRIEIRESQTGTREKAAGDISTSRGEMDAKADATNAAIKKIVDQRRELEEEISDLEAEASAGGETTLSTGQAVRNLNEKIAAVTEREQTLQSELIDIITATKNAQLKIEADKENVLTGLAEKGQEDRRKILMDGGKQMVRDLLQHGLERIRQGKENIKEEVEKVKQRTEDRLDADRALSRIRIDRLDEEAKAGNDAAAIESERLRIAEEFAAKHREISELLKNQALTERQRADLERERAGLEQREARAVDQAELARNKRGRGRSGPSTFDLQELSSMRRGFITEDDKAIERQQLAKQTATATTTDSLMKDFRGYLRLFGEFTRKFTGTATTNGQI